MPIRDKTGPAGEGAMTGRRLGDCGNTNTSFDRPGQGRGRGRGFNRMNYRVNTSDVKTNLEEEKKYLQNRLDEINKK
ncbi:MAG: DUF5320 domain-containing protein [Tenericutes bacterium]|nr:DUF5320 domain-containing protein [Mycoplasmatota bacterium]